MLKRIIEYFHAMRGTLVSFYRNNGVQIGSNCIILDRIEFGSEPYLIEIGNNCKLTTDIRFITHDGGIQVLRNLYPDDFKNADLFGQIKIGNNVFIGNSVIILPGVTIGDNVIIGTGAVVTRDIESNCVAAGVPCKTIHSIDVYCEKSFSKIVPTKALSYKEKEKYLKGLYNIK